MDTPSTAIGPGLGAFVAFFLLALALWLLMRNMSGRMRRMAYREQQRVAELQAKEAALPSKVPKAPREKRRKRPPPPSPQDTAQDDSADPAP